MEEGRTLKEEFDSATKQLNSLKSLSGIPATDPAFQTAVNETIKSFQRCEKLVYSLSLYSDNESVDDIATNDIKYLAVNYLLGQVSEKKIGGGGPGGRLETIERAIEYYTKYLKDLSNYGLLKKRLPKRIQDKLSSGTMTPGDIRPKASETVREEKIKRFNMGKELQQKIESLSASTDDEVVREVEFARLESLGLDAISAIESMNTEREMLARFRSLSTETFQGSTVRQNTDNRIQSVEELDNTFTDKVESRLTNRNTPMLTKDGKVNRPFTIVSSKREQIQRKVMGTGQYLPTMSVEEYLDEEMKRGGIIQGGGPSTKKDEDESESEDDEDKQDEKTYKARSWDEFVEANPKGSGNTINRG